MLYPGWGERRAKVLLKNLDLVKVNNLELLEVLF